MTSRRTCWWPPAGRWGATTGLGGRRARRVRPVAVPRARPDVTVVAHSFGSMVTGAALAHHGLECTEVVVAGSPGMTVDDLRQLHLDGAHFFTEEAPGDPVAELGVYGTEPTRRCSAAPACGPTPRARGGPRPLRVLRPRVRVARQHRGRRDRPLRRGGRPRGHLAESAGGLVAWALRLPTLPVGVVPATTGDLGSGCWSTCATWPTSQPTRPATPCARAWTPPGRPRTCGGAVDIGRRRARGRPPAPWRGRPRTGDGS